MENSENLKAMSEKAMWFTDQYQAFIDINRRVNALENENIRMKERYDNLNKNYESLHKDFETLKCQVEEDEETIVELRNQLANEIEKRVEINECAIRRIDDQIKNSTSECNEVRRGGCVNNSAIINKINLQAPTFKGEGRERPIKFLKDLRRYVELTQISDSQLRYIIPQFLEGPALNWYNVVEGDVQDFEDFEAVFKEQYWNESITKPLKRKLEFGTYDARFKSSRSEYAIDLFNLAKELDPTRNDEEIIKQIGCHFDREVRSVIRSRNANAKREFFEILSEFDADDLVEMRRERFHKTNGEIQQCKTAISGNEY